MGRRVPRYGGLDFPPDKVLAATVQTRVVNTYATTHVRNKTELGHLLRVDGADPSEGHDSEGLGGALR
ncbi:MAG TPA: hypothetical protein VFH83_02960 [Spirochaetia bacterium]|nr:hypothetical protein [Spirochaetia bacterium]